MDSSPPDLDGRALAEAYYLDVVAPLLARRAPDVSVAAGRLGAGSDVLGLDDAMSRDHDWGLRLTLLVPQDSVRRVRSLLDRELLATYAGLPTRFAFTGRTEATSGVDVTTPDTFLHRHLGLDPRLPMRPLDWLSLTGQAVLEVVAGPVFADPGRSLTETRRALAWYPDDVWRYVVASAWDRIGEEMPLMGRTGQLGDDLGSRVIAGRLVDTCVHLGLLLERQWAPYPKWRGTVAARLPALAEPLRALAATLAAGSWQNRQSALADALDGLLRLQVATGLSPDVRGPACVPFHDRPFLHPDPAVAERLLADITDPQVRDLPRGQGSIEQQCDNVAVLVNPASRRTRLGLPPGE